MVLPREDVDGGATAVHRDEGREMHRKTQVFRGGVPGEEKGATGQKGRHGTCVRDPPLQRLLVETMK